MNKFCNNWKYSTYWKWPTTQYESRKIISIDEFKSIIPVDHKNEILKTNFDPWYVANHLKTLIPIGIAIVIVADVKYVRVSIFNPTVNIWWAHAINPKNPIPNIA